MDAGAWERLTLRSHAQVTGALDAVAGAMAAAGYPERERFAVRLALAEALVNGLRHGNRGDPSKRVRVSYRVGPDGVTAEVEDEGAGFDPAAVPDPTAPGSRERPCGRGLFLMRAYLTECRFSERGNRVTLRKDRPPA
jgi:serine/threonine-protein kinase RsbW